MESERARLRLLISGRVQGVGFRYTAYDEARDLGLIGWVRNLPGGKVELVAEGRREKLQILAAWANQGPRMANVASVREEWSDFTGEFSEFKIR
ncbi:MAG TPA: acylphosphatase [Candidatus Binataceae bacterium]